MGSVESIAKHLIKLNNHKTNISFPAVVVNADRLEDGFVDVKPVVNYMNSVTGDTIEYPVIRGVRVVFPSSKSTTISFPLVQGDTVDLLFQSVDIEDFVNGNSSPHDPFSTGFGNLKNCVALVGFSPYQDSPFNPNNYKNEFNSQDLNIVHNKGTGLESSLNINTSGSILQKAPNAVTVDSPLFDVKSDLLNANNAVITTGGDVVVQGQSLNQFMLDAPLNLKGSDGNRGWTPVLAVENRGQEEAVLKITDWVGGEGDKPSEQGYIGSNGFVSDILDAINIRGARGESGAVPSDDTIQEAVNNQLTIDRVMDLIQGQIDESALTDILSSKIADINISKYSISQETEDRIEAIIEANSRIDDTNAQFINFQEDTGNEFIAQGERLDAIITEQSEQWTYWKTVTAEDIYASNQRITNLQSEFEDSNANFTNELFTLAEKDKSIAEDITQLYAETGENYGLLQDINIAISKPEGGLAAQVTELQSRATAAEILLTDKGEIIFSYGVPPAKKENKNNVWFKLKNEDNGIVSQTPHQWDGSDWVELKDSAALAAKADALAAKTVANNKGEVIYSNTAPAAAKRLPQNLWIDTSLIGGQPANTPKRWNGSAWVAVSDRAIYDAAKAASDAAALAGNKGEVIFSSSEPATDKRKAQNLWIDTSGGKNTPKRWAGSSWLTVTDKAATDAQAAADKANKQLLPANIASLVEGSGAFSDEFDSISGQFTNFEAVISGQKTAMEVISSIGNAEKLKNEVAKARLDKNVTNLNAQSAALTVQINGYTTKISEVTAKRNATSDTALKAEYNKLITDLTAARTDLTAQKAVIADQVSQLAAEKKVLDDFKEVENGVRAQHTIKMDSGGKIVGFGLVLQKSGFSAFDVRADRFSISAPVGKPNDVNGTSPFMVLTNQQTINGVKVEAGVYMRDFYAPRGSIDTLQVVNGAIDTLQVKDGAIKTAKIGNAQVNTLQIAGQAVIQPVIQYTAGAFNFYSIDKEEVINTATVNAQGGPVSISFGFESLRARINSRGASPAVILRIKRGTTVLRTMRLVKEGPDYYLAQERVGSDNYRTVIRSNPDGLIQYDFVNIPTFLDDKAPSGTNTYTVTLESRGLNAGKNSTQLASSPVIITARSLHIMGVKR